MVETQVVVGGGTWSVLESRQVEWNRGMSCFYYETRLIIFGTETIGMIEVEGVAQK